MNDLNLETLRADARARADRIDARFETDKLIKDADLPVTLLAPEGSTTRPASNSLDEGFFKRFVGGEHLTTRYADAYKAALRT
jgi:hypothetical protein